MSIDLIEKLERARDVAEVPFKINSGYRCLRHNKAVGGKPRSAHLSGEAVDIAADDSYYRFRIIRGLLIAGFKRIGIAHTFIHADVDGDKGQQLIWTY
jgi:hypothetical protein